VTTAPHGSSTDLAQRLRTNARVCEIVAARPLSSCLHEVVLRGDALTLSGVPGNDVMIRLANESGVFVRRRYSVRSVEPELDRFTLWISTFHDGVGSQWAQNAQPGDAVDVVGPRGKIPLNPEADWHLFMGDVTGFSAFYRMAQSIEAPGRAIFIIEIDHDDDARTTEFDEGVGVTGIFVNRFERQRNDPSILLSGLSAFALPRDLGHAYLFGEFSVIKVLRDALLDRGLSDEQISRKAYWRAGRRNGENGEPEKDEG
jgi:NADPH-dependent ferric siderophore reductase